MSKLGPVFLILLLLSGCLGGLGNPTQPGGTSPTDTSLVSTSPAMQAAPTAMPGPTRTPTSTQTAVPTGSLPPPTTPTRTLGLDDPPYDLEGLKTWLADAWQSGRPAEQVRAQLEAAGWLQAELYRVLVGEEEREFSAWQTVDMNGDGRDEWLFAPAEGLNACGFPLGALWLLGRPGLLVWEDAGQGHSFGSPLMIDQADFNGDGFPDVLAFASDCQSDTQIGAFFIFSLQATEFKDLISLENDLYRAAQTLRRGSGDPVEAIWPGPAITISLPAYEILDITGDGLPDLVLNGGNYHSAEAGEVRPRSETWAWDGQAVSLQGIWWLPSGQRFDTLYDANLALELGELAEAEELYLQVLQDDSLLDEVGLAPPEANRAAARQFAAFRLEVIGMLRGSLSAAQHYRDLLVAEYPDAALTQAADLLLEDWRTSVDLPAACREAIALLEGFDNPTGSLADAGYGLPKLGAGEVCPNSVLP